MTKIAFTPGAWEDQGLEHAYSWCFPELPTFRQEPDCLINSIAPGTRQEYDYMGLLLPQTYTTGTKISVRCSFEGLAAPMLVISPENEVDENGVLRTLEYFEVVIWHKGLNVWRMHTDNRNVTHYKVLGASFPVAEKEIHNLSVKLLDQRMLIRLDDQELELFVHDLPQSYRLGYNACEGICRLYEMTVE